MGKTIDSILLLACFGLVSSLSFSSGRKYEREQRPIPQSPTVRFAIDGVVADVYLDKGFTDRHPQKELDAVISFAILNAAGNLELSGTSYRLAMEMDRLCVEQKMDAFFGEEAPQKNHS